MIRGLPASLLLHAAVLGAGYLAWPYVGTSVVEDEFVIVPVELVDVGEMTNIAPVTEPPEEVEPEPEEEPEPAPPEPEESEAPVEEEPDERDIPEDDVSTASQSAAPEPEVEDVLPDLEAEPEDRPEPEEEPEEPKPQPKAPNPRQERNPLDDFLSDAESTFESERETKRETQPPKREEQQLLKDTPPVQEPRRGAGERTANTVRIEQLLYNQIHPCWDGVADQPDPKRLNVSMRAELDAEGNITDIELIRPARAPIGDRSMSLAIERALRAVRKCQPYRLPSDDYELWKIANINLGPAFTDD